jgi:hypothetical protein
VRCQQRHPFWEGGAIWVWAYGCPPNLDQAYAANSIVLFGKGGWMGMGLCWPGQFGPSVRCQQRRPFWKGGYNPGCGKITHWDITGGTRVGQGLQASGASFGVIWRHLASLASFGMARPSGDKGRVLDVKRCPQGPFSLYNPPPTCPWPKYDQCHLASFGVIGRHWVSFGIL